MPSSLTVGDHTLSPDPDLKGNTHERKRESQISLAPYDTNALKHAVISAEKCEFFFADMFSKEDPV